MIITAQGLLDKARMISKNNNLSVNEVVQRYFFDQILERISISKYKFNFILKGGALISSFIGIENRTTKDIDATIKGINLNKDDLLIVLNEILEKDIKDNIKFKIENIKDIKDEDKYGGLRFNLKCKLENIEIPLSIDFATGDEITPREIEYNYTTLLDSKIIKIMCYNKETIIAEKLQTIVEKSILNSRMKDFYDIYYLLKQNDYDENILKQAIENTFKRRNSDKNKILKTINTIKENDLMNERWNNYSDKHRFAKNILFKDIIIQIESAKDYL